MGKEDIIVTVTENEIIKAIEESGYKVIK